MSIEDKIFHMTCMHNEQVIKRTYYLMAIAGGGLLLVTERTKEPVVNVTILLAVASAVAFATSFLLGIIVIENFQTTTRMNITKIEISRRMHNDQLSVEEKISMNNKMDEDLGEKLGKDTIYYKWQLRSLFVGGVVFACYHFSLIATLVPRR